MVSSGEEGAAQQLDQTSGDDQIAGPSWPVRLTVLASTAEALSEDLMLLVQRSRAPDPATVATGRVLAALARDLHTQVGSVVALPSVPPRSALLEGARLLHDACASLQSRIANLVLDAAPPGAVDVVEAAELVAQAERLQHLIARCTLKD